MAETRLTERNFLVVDIGKSYLRARAGSLSCGQARAIVDFPRKRNSRSGFSDVKDFVGKSVHQLKQTYGVAQIATVVLCVPGRVSHDRRFCTLDYLGTDQWFDIAEELAELDIANYVALNEAGIWGIQHATPDSLFKLCGVSGQSDPYGTILLVHPGSGLGAGIGLQDGLTIPSSAGEIHLSVFANRPEEIELFNYLVKGRLQRSYGAVVSARGIVDMTDYLISKANSDQHTKLRRLLAASNEVDRAEIISQIALAHRPAPNPTDRELCYNAMAFFTRFLSRFLQNLSLILWPEAIYLGGSIINGNIQIIQEEFPKQFQQHYRKAYFGSVPVFISMDQELNLTGAFHAAIHYSVSRFENGSKI
jgi:glucokinase